MSQCTATLASLALVMSSVLLLTDGKTDYIHAIACEGDELELDRCPQRQAILVNTAVFGRSNSFICGGKTNSTTPCGEIDVRHRVKAMCDARTVCRFIADTTLLGEVKECVYVPKYLNVYYRCEDNFMEDECTNQITSLSNEHENTLITVDTTDDQSAKFSLRNHSGASMIQQEILLLFLVFLWNTC